MRYILFFLMSFMTMHVVAQEVSNDAKQAYNDAIGLFNNKEYAKAISAYSKAIDLDKSFTKAIYGRAVAQFKAKNLDAAIKDFRKVLKAEPNNGRAHQYKGLAYMKKKDYSLALKSFDDALEQADTLYSSYANRAVIYMKMKQYDNAIADFSKVIDHKSSSNMLMNRGICYYNTKIYDRAIMDFFEVEPSDKTDRLIAKSYYKLKKYEKAQSVLQALEERGKANAEDFFLLGHMMSTDGDLAGATAYMDKALVANPKHLNAAKQKAVLSIQQEDYASAEQDYSRLIRLGEQKKEIFLNRALSRMQLKKYEDAIKDFNTVIEKDPKDGASYYNRGSAYLSLDKKAEACSDMRDAGRLNYEPAFEIIRDFCK